MGIPELNSLPLNRATYRKDGGVNGRIIKTGIPSAVEIRPRDQEVLYDYDVSCDSSPTDLGAFFGDNAALNSSTCTNDSLFCTIVSFRFL